MNISKLNIYEFTAPFKNKIQTNLVTMRKRKVLVIGLVIDDIEYFAEANSFETDWYHHETIATVYQGCIELFHKLKGHSVTFEKLSHYADPLQPNVKSCFDSAIYQHCNRLANVVVPIGQTIHQLDTAIQSSAHRVKLKMHHNILEQVKAIRATDDIKIVIDANGLLNIEHFDLIKQIAEYNILYFEQPFNAINLYRKFTQMYPDINLAIDESATSVDEIKRYYDAGIQTAVIKYSRIGGITTALNLMEQFPDLNLISGGMYEFKLSKYFTAILGQQFNTVPDVTPEGTYFNEDFAIATESIDNGMLTMSPPKVDRNRLKFIASFK